MAKKTPKKTKTEKCPSSAMRLREPVGGVEVAKLADGENGQRRIKILANSGGIIPNHWYWGNFAIDLKGIEIGKQKRPILRDHDDSRIVGYTESIKVTENGLEVEGVNLAETPDGIEVAALSDAGFPWESSIYVPPTSIERVDAGATAEVNGQKLTGPGAIFRKCRLREVSVCTLGADENTSAVALSNDGSAVEVEVIQHKSNEEDDEMKLSELTAEQLKTDRPDLVDELTKGLTEAAEAKAASALKAERERVTEILNKSAEFKMPELAAELVANGVSTGEALSKLKDAKIEALEKAAPESPGPNEDPESELSDANLSEDEKLDKQWKKDAALRAEFGNDLDTFKAYSKANADGRCRVIANSTK